MIRRVVVTLALGLIASGCWRSFPPISDNMTAGLELPRTLPHVVPGAAVVVLAVQDLRAPALGRTHFAQASSRTSLCFTVLGGESARSDGPIVAGDPGIQPIDMNPNHPPLVLDVDAYLGSVFAKSFGTALARSAQAVNLDDMRGSAAAAPGGNGIVVLPLLDELDVTKLSSEDAKHMFGSSTDRDTTTTTSAFTSESSSTSRWANVRLRLILLDVRGGVVTQQSVAYMATTNPAVADAMQEVAREATLRLVAFVEGRRALAQP